MPKYSVIIPIYNRPDELDELLQSLTEQSFTDFEVVVVEDGSTITCDHLIEKYEQELDLHYYFKINEGQGFARNYGFEKAKGEFLVVFDSDCLIPPQYFSEVDTFLQAHPVDAYGGPDGSLSTFTSIQKAISHTMTSLFTTGGIRGSKKHVGEYHPRSFNMGIHRKVYEKTNGYRIPFMGEDLEFSTRIIKEGFSTALIPDAIVYHKRRTSLRQFFKQINYFGRARINLTRFHPEQISLIHLFPLVFSLGLITSIILALSGFRLGILGVSAYGGYLGLVAIEGVIKTKSIAVGIISIATTLIQMFGYGLGLCQEYIQKLRGVDPNKPYIDLY